MSGGVGCRSGSDTELLWLWCRAAAAAPIRPLAWERPCATGAAVKSQKKKSENHCPVSITMERTSSIRLPSLFQVLPFH